MTNSLLDIFFLIIEAFWRRRFLILVPVILLPPIGFAIGLQTAKTYQSRMTMLVQEPAKESPFLDDLAVGTRLQERMPVLESLVRNSRLIETVAADVGLITPSTSQAVRDQIVSQISAGLSIELVGTDLVDLSLRTKSIETTDQILSQLAAHFVDRLVGPERTAIAGSVKFLGQQVDTRRGMVEEAEELLARFAAEHAEELPEATTAAERMSSLRKQLDEQRANERAARAKLESESPVTSPVVSRLSDELVKLTAEAAVLRGRYTPQHPALRDVLARIEKLEQERAARAAIAGSGPASAALSDQQLSARADLAIARAEVAQLEDEIAKVAPLLPRSTELARHYADLETRLSAEREFYENVVKRYEMTRITGDLALFEATDRVKIIDPPVAPTGSALSPYLFLVAGIIAGIGLGAGLAVLAELGDSSLRASRELERRLGLRLLARFPAVSKARQCDLATLPRPGVAALERGGGSAMVHPIKSTGT